MVLVLNVLHVEKERSYETMQVMPKHTTAQKTAYFVLLDSSLVLANVFVPHAQQDITLLVEK
jgi:hypothetical protein